MSQYDQVQYKQQHLYALRKSGKWLRKQENHWKTIEFLNFLKNQVSISSFKNLCLYFIFILKK